MASPAKAARTISQNSRRPARPVPGHAHPRRDAPQPRAAPMAHRASSTTPAAPAPVPPGNWRRASAARPPPRRSKGRLGAPTTPTVLQPPAAPPAPARPTKPRAWSGIGHASRGSGRLRRARNHRARKHDQSTGVRCRARPMTASRRQRPPRSAPRAPPADRVAPRDLAPLAETSAPGGPESPPGRRRIPKRRQARATEDRRGRAPTFSNNTSDPPGSPVRGGLQGGPPRAAGAEVKSPVGTFRFVLALQGIRTAEKRVPP